MATFTMDIDVIKIGTEILGDELKVLGEDFEIRRNSPKVKTEIDLPEFVGSGRVFQMNTVDGVTYTKRRIRLEAGKKVPTATIYINSIDADEIQLVSTNTTDTPTCQDIRTRDSWKGNANVINEIITIIQLRRLALSFWFQESSDTDEPVLDKFNKYGIIEFLLNTVFVRSGYTVRYEESGVTDGTDVPRINIYSGSTLLYSLGVRPDSWTIFCINRIHNVDLDELKKVEMFLILSCNVLNSLNSGIPMFK
jgi:hypothetical protein